MSNYLPNTLFLALRSAVLAAGSLLSLALSGQTAPKTGSSGATTAGEETIVLTPFEVSTNQDTGYAGQDTLSGSRLRTNLKDVAAAISPMTAEFLRDIAATSVEGAMEYGVGTRMETDDARAAGPVADGYNDGVRSIRIRGLPGGGRSINFFSAPGEVDLYMIESLEVSRGPNSILFGFGSPAGKINIASKQARTDKHAYSLTSRTDSWGGQRWSADANRVLLKNTLALRAVVLRGRESSWRAAGHNDQDRAFVTAKWQPDRRTNVRVEFEHGEINRFVPRPFFANDLKSTWEQSGQPFFNNFPASYVPGTSGTGATGTPGTPIRDTGNTNVVGVLERSGGDWVVVSPSFPLAQNYRQFTYSESPTGGNLANDFAMGRSNPEAVLEANWVRGQFRVKNASAFVQRELARDLNIELGFNRQLSRGDTHNLATWNHYGVAADTNRYTPTGQLKPANQLYYFDVSPDHRPTSSAVSQGRVTVSYERAHRDLIRLRLAGLGEMSGSKSRSEILQQYWLKGPSLTSGGVFNATPENGANQAFQRFYFPNLAQFNDPNVRIPGPMNLTDPVKYQDPRTGAVSDIYMREFNRSQGNIGYADRETGAWMGVAQAFLFKNRFVGTFGYRKDRLKSWVGLARRDPAGEALAPNTGVWTPVDPRTSPFSVFSGQTRTLGGVLHVTSWASVFFNTSNSVSTPGTNYITPADPRKTTIADLVPSPSGKTTDYGVKLSLLKNRLFLTATQFHTVSQREFGFSGFNKGNPVNIWNALATSTALNAEETAFARRQAEVMNQVQGYTQDSESKGREFEVVGRLTDGWSLSVNYSQNNTTRTNMAPEYRAYLNHHKPYWKKHGDLSLTQSINQPLPQRAPSSTDWRTPADISATGDFTINTDSVNEAIADAEQLFFDNPYVFEGKRFVGDPLHNINLRTRYDFRDGVLKGFSVGGGTRWRLGRVAGARTDYSIKAGSDYTDMWNGRTIDKVSTVDAKDQNVYDLQLSYALPIAQRKVRWSVQLNVNNLLDQRELIVNNVHSRTLAPLTYRYQDPRQFILTNTFSF
jgi:outer membrane receptor protein involved in Fe transport